MGTRGPIPKRADQRRRRNLPTEGHVTKAPGSLVVDAPSADPSWHPVAVRWFESLATSGQAVHYEPSDYATAYLLAESMSRELSRTAEDGRALPPKAASLTTWLSGCTSLMATEGDRRRARLELERPVAGPDDGVALLADYRRRILS